MFDNTHCSAIWAWCTNLSSGRRRSNLTQKNSLHQCPLNPINNPPPKEILPCCGLIKLATGIYKMSTTSVVHIVE